MQVDMMQSGVLSMMSSGSSATSSGDSTRRSRCHGRMSSFSFSSTSVLLKCRESECNHNSRLMNVIMDHGGEDILF